jgi:hypothetical protein
MREHAVNTENNFIMGWYVDNPVLEEINKFHEFNIENNLAEEGYSLLKGEKIVNTEVKRSKDSLLNWKEDLCLTYMTSVLKPCADEYLKKYSHAGYGTLGVEEATIVQKYFPPDGGFVVWHNEKPGGETRHFVFMTYLNDVTDGGETEFLYQDVKIKPEKGLTLIFPTEWTHTHRGLVSPTQEKTIVTGWLSRVKL